MEIDPKLFDYDSFTTQSTGSINEGEESKIITTYFDRYEIKIRVSPKNEFKEIVEIKFNKNFLSQKQRIGMQSYIDVDTFYRE